jgi:Gluconate 2-dehydrogenase subunit 3
MAKPKVLPVVAPRQDGGVGRRHVLQGLLTGVGAGLAVPGLAATHPLAEHAHHPLRMADAQAKARDENGEPECLDAYQVKMLESLSERIVPGAAAAGCARFVDRLLAASKPEDIRTFLTALGAIEGESRSRYGRPWPDLDETQQSELLAAASSQAAGQPDRGFWTPGTPVADYLQPPVEVPPEGDVGPRLTLRDHFDHLKGWVVGAYYSSEAGLRELGYTGPAFAESFPGCTHEGGHRES